MEWLEWFSRIVVLQNKSVQTNQRILKMRATQIVSHTMHKELCFWKNMVFISPCKLAIKWENKFLNGNVCQGLWHSTTVSCLGASC